METYHVTPDHNTFMGRNYAPDVTLSGDPITHDPTVVGDEDNKYDQSYIHGYKDPLVAAFLFPAIDWFTPGAKSIPPHHLWHGQTACPYRDDGLRVHAKQIKIIDQIPMPEVTLLQRQRFALICAISLFHHANFVDWANKWLNNGNRNPKVALALNEQLLKEPMEGRDIGYCALAGIIGLPEHRDLEMPLEVYCAAAGWKLWSGSEGKKALIPAIRFAQIEK